MCDDNDNDAVVTNTEMIKQLFLNENELMKLNCFTIHFNKNEIHSSTNTNTTSSTNTNTNTMKQKIKNTTFIYYYQLLNLYGFICHNFYFNYPSFMFESYQEIYNQLIKMVAGVILEINPKFEYPYAFATNLFEMSNNHIYFAKHLPSLTDIEGGENRYTEVEKMLNYFSAKLLGY
jgi:hypothetical protein